MLSREEKYISRIILKNKFLEANGQAFEDIFTSIMNYSEQDFRSIKPWGNIGDRKNDGYIPSKGVFYQVFAPEDIRKSYPDVISKIKRDFAGLKSQWNPINEFYFVVNDKFLGVNADSEQEMQEIVKSNSLTSGGFQTAKDLENKLFLLDDDQIESIIGSIPDPSKIKTLDYSVLNEVIIHIMSMKLPKGKSPNVRLPEWNEKIEFNDLSTITAHYLSNGFIQVRNLELFLSNNSDFLADELRDKLNDIYVKESKVYTGDELFWRIVNEASPLEEQTHQSAVIVIMSKYFESCDIFEEPEKDES